MKERQRNRKWDLSERKSKISDPLIMDWYHILQAFILFMENEHRRRVVFDYFVRKTLPGSSYQLVAGTEEVLKRLASLKFSKRDIKNLQRQFEGKGIILLDEFVQYLKNFRFRADVWAIREGNLAFPNEPIMRVEGEFFEALIVESLILSRMNYASGIATKASRIVKAARGIPVAEFGLRRSPNDAVSTRAAIIGGFDSTSNVRSAIDLGVPSSGTTAHALVQAFIKLKGSEKEAFKTLLKYSDTLLVDTIDIEQGIKNAISAAKELDKRVSIRIDSGDLIKSAFLARELDTEGWINRIILTSDLEEQRISEIVESGAEVNGFGAGTYAVNVWPPVGGVYKIVAVEKDGEFLPSIKISGDEIKILLPGRKNVWREKDKKGNFIGDLIMLADEAHPGDEYEPILMQAMAGGKIEIPYLNAIEIREFAKERLKRLPEAYGRIKNPETYPVAVSEKLAQLKAASIKESKEEQGIR